MPRPPVGSLVAPSPAYRASMETGEGAALLLAILRGNARLYYPATDRAFWVPMRKVAPIPPDVVPEESLERLLSALLLFLETIECSVARYEDDAMELEISIPVLSSSWLEEVQAMLGERLADWVVDPGTMRNLMLKLALVSLPKPLGAGR